MRASSLDLNLHIFLFVFRNIYDIFGNSFNLCLPFYEVRNGFYSGGGGV